jgi:hypothetical protein
LSQIALAVGTPFTDAEALEALDLWSLCPGRLFLSSIEPDRHIRTPGSVAM